LTYCLGIFVINSKFHHDYYVDDWFGWRANFLVLVVISIILIIYFYSLPETKLQTCDKSKLEKINELVFIIFKDPKIFGSSWIVAAVNGVLFSADQRGDTNEKMIVEFKVR
jgi:MFS family permease